MIFYERYTGDGGDLEQFESMPSPLDFIESPEDFRWLFADANVPELKTYPAKAITPAFLAPDANNNVYIYQYALYKLAFRQEIQDPNKPCPGYSLAGKFDFDVITDASEWVTNGWGTLYNGCVFCDSYWKWEEIRGAQQICPDNEFETIELNSLHLRVDSASTQTAAPQENPFYCPHVTYPEWTRWTHPLNPQFVYDALISYRLRYCFTVVPYRRAIPAGDDFFPIVPLLPIILLALPMLLNGAPGQQAWRRTHGSQGSPD